MFLATGYVWTNVSEQWDSAAGRQHRRRHPVGRPHRGPERHLSERPVPSTPPTSGPGGVQPGFAPLGVLRQVGVTCAVRGAGVSPRWITRPPGADAPGSPIRYSLLSPTGYNNSFTRPPKRWPWRRRRRRFPNTQGWSGE